MVFMGRHVRLLLVAMMALVLAAGCASTAAVTTGTTAAQADAPPATNDFVPTDQNLSSCVGTLELPNCGSEKKGDLQLYLTFGALVAGVSVIGWRISKGLKRNEREGHNAPTNTY
jgi:hypothetical protein